MLARQADVFVQIECGDAAPVELHAGKHLIETQRGAAGGEAEHGAGLVAQQPGDDPRGDAGSLFGRGLDDDFHQVPSLRQTSALKRSMKPQT